MKQGLSSILHTTTHIEGFIIDDIIMKMSFISVLLIICCSCVTFSHQWTEISGGLKHISSSVNYLWGVDSNDKIYRCTRPCTGNWVNIAGGLMQVDVSDIEVWGVTSANHIYKRSIDAGGSWVKVNGLLKHVSASGNGYIWGVNSGDYIYKCKKPCNGAWINVPGRLKQIDGGEKYVYGVNSGNTVYSRPVDGSGGWFAVPGKKMQYVSVGHDEVFGIDEDSDVYRCKIPCIGNWEEMAFDEGSMGEIDATIDGVFGVSTGGTIYEKEIA